MKNLIKIVFIFLSLIFNSISSQTKDDILPVELVYFEAYLTYGGVLLRWGTATEVNNFGFEIQRADSSYQFVGIGFVPGSGNSNSPKHYFYVDSLLVDFGIYHYRLKIIDIDGYYDYSDTVHVLYQPSKVTLQDNKNPDKIYIVNDIQSKELIFDLNNNYELNEIFVSIYNILGQRVFVKVFPNVSNSFRVSYNFFPNGIYLISLHSKDKILLTQKFIVLH